MRDWLLEIRLKKQLTQAAIAKKAKITRTYYTQIENGGRRPSVDVARRIAEHLEFDWTLFFNETDTEVK